MCIENFHLDDSCLPCIYLHGNKSAALPYTPGLYRETEIPLSWQATRAFCHMLHSGESPGTKTLSLMRINTIKTSRHTLFWIYIEVIWSEWWHLNVLLLIKRSFHWYYWNSLGLWPFVPLHKINLVFFRVYAESEWTQGLPKHWSIRNIFQKSKQV